MIGPFCNIFILLRWISKFQLLLMHSGSVSWDVYIMWMKSDYHIQKVEILYISIIYSLNQHVKPFEKWLNRHFESTQLFSRPLIYYKNVSTKSWLNDVASVFKKNICFHIVMVRWTVKTVLAKTPIFCLLIKYFTCF